MLCDPTSLSQAAQSFKRIPKQMLAAVRIFLECQWANKGSGPPPPPVPPAVPTSIDITDGSMDSNTTVIWTNADVPTTNEVWKSTDGINFVLFDTVGGGVHTDTDLSAMADGDSFFYKVRACNGVTCSAFSTVVSVSKNIDFGGAYAAATLIRDTLVWAYGTYNFSNSANLTTASFALLRHVGTDFNADGCPLLTSLSVPKLIDTGGNCLVENCAVIASLSFPSLVTVGLAFAFDTCPLLTTATYPKLASVTDFVPSTCNVLTSISAPVLTTVTGSFVADSCPLVATISIPLLPTIGNNFSAQQCTSLTTLVLTSLTVISGDFQIQGCSILATLSFPAGTTFNGVLLADNCTSLSNVSLPNAFFVNGQTVTFTNCNIAVGNSAAATGIDGILRQLVNSGVVTDTIDLSGGTNATPDAPGQADKTTLILAGNAIVTN